MAELTVDLTYGSALYEAAEDVGKRDEIAKNADWVLEVLRREKRKKRSRRYSTGMYARNF